MCMCGRGGGQQFSVYYLFILNSPTLNCLQFKPKLFSLLAVLGFCWQYLFFFVSTIGLNCNYCPICPGLTFESVFHLMVLRIDHSDFDAIRT